MLRASVEGEQGFLRFECRIGHVVSLEGLLEAKEKNLEDALWDAVLEAEELSAVLRDIAARAELASASITPDTCRERAIGADALSAAMRELIALDAPLRMNVARTAVPSGRDPGGKL